MILGSRRYQARNGVTGVMFTHYASPYVTAYRFRYDTGWGTKYTAPASISSFSGRGSGVVFGPENNRALVSGRDSTNSSDYLWSQDGGFSTRTNIALNQISSFDFLRDGTRVLLSRDGSVAEYNYSSGSGIGSQVFTVTGPAQGLTAGYILDDQYFFMGVFNGFQIRSRANPATTTASVAGPSFASPLAFSMSPITVSGNRLLAVSYDNAQCILYNVSASGTIASTATGPHPSSEVVLFDPKGRLFIGFSPNIKLHTVSGTVATVVSTLAIANAGGQTIPMTLSYDEDNDVLFYGTTNSIIAGTLGGIAAVKMGGSGFISQYTAPASPPTGSVHGIGLSYGDRWKNAIQSKNFAS